MFFPLRNHALQLNFDSSLLGKIELKYRSLINEQVEFLADWFELNLNYLKLTAISNQDFLNI